MKLVDNISAKQIPLFCSQCQRNVTTTEEPGVIYQCSACGAKMTHWVKQEPGEVISGLHRRES
jgi:predicted amidophosphoribosyltransferase